MNFVYYIAVHFFLLLLNTRERNKENNSASESGLCIRHTLKINTPFFACTHKVNSQWRNPVSYITLRKRGLCLTPCMTHLSST